jgi:hypothetical protein
MNPHGTLHVAVNVRQKRDGAGELAATSRARIAQRPQVAGEYVVLCIVALPTGVLAA